MTCGSDLYFKVDWDEIWPLKSRFEPLLIFVCLTYRSATPRIEARDKLLETLRRSLHGNGVREISSRDRRDLCANFYSARALCPL
jgi:hypothetical protein